MDGTQPRQWQVITIAALGVLALWGVFQLQFLLPADVSPAFTGKLSLVVLVVFTALALIVSHRLGKWPPRKLVARVSLGLLNAVYVVLVATAGRSASAGLFEQLSLLAFVLFPALSMLLVSRESSSAFVRARLSLIYLGILPQIALLQQISLPTASQSLFGMPTMWLANAIVWLFALSMFHSWSYPVVHLRVQKELLPRWLALVLSIVLLLAASPLVYRVLSGADPLEGPAFASFLLAALSCYSIFAAVPRLRKWGSGPPAKLTLVLALVFGPLLLAMHWGLLELPARYNSTASLQLLLLALTGWLLGLPKQGTLRRPWLSGIHTASIALLFGLLWWALPLAGALPPWLFMTLFLGFLLAGGLAYSRIELSYRELANAQEDPVR